MFRQRIALVFASVVLLWPAVGLLQQPAPSGAAAQPAIKWNEEQIKRAVQSARVGRRLTPKSWPNGARVAVSLSFDIDNEYLTRPVLLPVPLSQGEYGAVQALPRILALIDGQQIPASFYAPASSLMNHPEMIKAIQASGRHEIGLHGWIHENLAALDDAAEEERLLKQSIDYLTKATGKRPVGIRAPSWALSRHSLGQFVKAGLLYDSSMMGADDPYEVVIDGQNSGLIELPIEWILDDAPYFGQAGALPSPEMIFKVYRDEFDVAYREKSLFVLTMHPHVVGHRSRMVELEKLVAYMKAKPGVWFATGEQIAKYLKEQNAGTR
jgi:peptidoglycan/xylan/chitin deacetylase (PgdA/CDA1 family)